MTSTAATARTTTPAKILAVVMGVLVALALLPGAAQAITTKGVTKCGFTTETSVIKKKATTVKKGATKIVVKKGQGYVKFKAPKTAKYAFTFSDLKSSTKYSSYGFVEFQTPDKRSPKYSFLTDLSTAGGKTDALKLTINGAKSSGTGVYKYLAKRTGKIKLTKGQWAFFYFYNSSNKTTAKLTINVAK